MSTLTTTYGVYGDRTYDELYINTLDMEPYTNRYSSGVWTRGSSGYILLNVTGLSWSGSGTFGPTDIMNIDFDIAGFNPTQMTQIHDTTGVPLSRYRINTSSGSISFGSGTGNEAKYVWVVKDGVVDGASLNEDGTFSAARLKVYLQETNVLTSAINFTVTYTLTFVDLASTISSLSTSTAANLSIDDAKPLHRKLLSQSALSGSGYGIFKVGSLTSAVEIPPRTSVFNANPDAAPPVFSVTLDNGSKLWEQYASRYTRTKTFNTNLLYVLYAVNQGKVGANADNVDAVYDIAELRLDRGSSDDNATVTMNYGLSFASV